MYGYLAKRLALVFPTLIMVTMLVFLLMRLIPGDPAYLRLIGADGDAAFTRNNRTTSAPSWAPISRFPNSMDAGYGTCCGWTSVCP